MFKNKTSKTLLLALLTAGCSTPQPHKPLVLAREALASAREVDAGRYAPGLFYQAEEAYRKALADYKGRDYSRAAREFDEAREFAEKAEDTARIQRQKAGDEAL